MADFTNYTPPGVYVQDESSPIVTVTNTPSGLLCLVGPARGYQPDAEVLKVYSQGTGTALRHRGVYVDSIVGPPAIAAPRVTLQRDPSVVLVAGVDYELTTEVDAPGGSRNAITSITRIADDADPTNPLVDSPNGLIDGESVVITYSYADLAYYAPQLLQDYDYVTALYGDPFNTDGSLNSPLSVATRIAFANTVTQVLTLALDPEDGSLRAQLIAAYAKVANDYRVGVIVPLLDETSASSVSGNFGDLADDLRSHCVTAATNGYGRIGILGAPATYDDDVPFDQVAVNQADKRLVLAYPNRVNLSTGGTAPTEVGGYYLASAYGALLVSGNTNRGLTKRVVAGFSGLPSSVQQIMTPQFKDNLSRSGVAVTEVDRLGRMTVRHGVSTEVQDLLGREISLVRIADSLYQLVQGGLEASELIGEPIDNEMTSRVKGLLSSILERAVADKLIVSWQDLKVRQQALPNGDPTIIDCKFAYKAAVPLNYITVGFQIDLTTGITTETAA